MAKINLINFKYWLVVNFVIACLMVTLIYNDRPSLNEDDYDYLEPSRSYRNRLNYQIAMQAFNKLDEKYGDRN